MCDDRIVRVSPAAPPRSASRRRSSGARGCRGSWVPSRRRACGPRKRCAAAPTPPPPPPPCAPSATPRAAHWRKTHSMLISGLNARTRSVEPGRHSAQRQRCCMLQRLSSTAPVTFRQAVGRRCLIRCGRSVPRNVSCAVSNAAQDPGLQQLAQLLGSQQESVGFCGKVKGFSLPYLGLDLPLQQLAQPLQRVLGGACIDVPRLRLDRRQRRRRVWRVVEVRSALRTMHTSEQCWNGDCSLAERLTLPRLLVYQPAGDLP